MLRVASTEEPAWWGTGPQEESESFVTTLGERDGALVQLGRVGGLGKGERVYAVRFVGDTGYVVTFRQVDPLYTLDLSPPSRPAVLGELKIRGYSAYLHPLGDDLLLGVGQDATEEGRVLGTQLSLFDVSDLRRPVRITQYALGSSLVGGRGRPPRLPLVGPVAPGGAARESRTPTSRSSAPSASGSPGAASTRSAGSRHGPGCGTRPAASVASRSAARSSSATRSSPSRTWA